MIALSVQLFLTTRNGRSLSARSLSCVCAEIHHYLAPPGLWRRDGCGKAEKLALQVVAKWMFHYSSNLNIFVVSNSNAQRQRNATLWPDLLQGVKVWDEIRSIYQHVKRGLQRRRAKWGFTGCCRDNKGYTLVTSCNLTSLAGNQKLPCKSAWTDLISSSLLFHRRRTDSNLWLGSSKVPGGSIWTSGYMHANTENVGMKGCCGALRLYSGASQYVAFSLHWTPKENASIHEKWSFPIGWIAVHML